MAKFLKPLLIKESAAPATPAAGQVALYAKADGRFYSKDDTGLESLVGYRYDFVYTYGADPTGLTSSRAAYEAARTAAMAAGGFEVYVPPGHYLFNESTRLPPVQGGLAFRGGGPGISTWHFTHLNGGLDLGVFDSATNSGGLSEITITGFPVSGGAVAQCRNPLRIEWIVGWVMDNVEQTGAKYDATDPGMSCGVFCELAQNVEFRNMQIRKNEHHGLVIDRGAGNGKYYGGSVSLAGQSGNDGRNLLVRQSAPYDPLPPGLPHGLTSPFKWKFVATFLEFASPGQTIMVELVTSANFTFSSYFSGGDDSDTGLVLVRLQAGSDYTVFDGSTWFGTPSTPASPNTSGIVGISVADLSEGNKLTGKPAEFSHLDTCVYADNLAEFHIDADMGDSLTTVVTRKAGPGLNRITETWISREALPAVASEQTRTGMWMAKAVGAGAPDRLYVGKRGNTATGHGFYDLLNQATVTDWVADTFYYRDELRVVAGVLRRADVDHLATATVQLGDWTIVGSGPAVFTGASQATLTPNCDLYNAYTLTAQAAALTVANPNGTPTDFQKMQIRLLDNGTGRAIGYGTAYAARAGVPLPAATVAGKYLHLGFEYSASAAKWILLAAGQEA